MPKPQKKRNKKYVPKLRCFPLGMRNEHQFEIPFLTAMSTLGTPSFDRVQLHKLAEFGYIAAELGAPDEWDPWSETIDSIWSRNERTGKIGATGDEMAVIRDIGPKILQFLRDKTNYQIVKAATSLLDKYKKGFDIQNREAPPMPPTEDGSDSYVPYGDHINVD